MAGANEVAWTSRAGVGVGTVQRVAVGAADVAFRGRFLRLALLDDLRRLRIGRDAMLQRLAQLDPGGGELQGVRINGHQPAVDQPLVDFRIARLQRQALVDPLYPLKRSESRRGGKEFVSPFISRWGPGH